MSSHKVKKVFHHIKHTRPSWYVSYHQWEHAEKLHWMTFWVSFAVILLGLVNAIMLIKNRSLQRLHAATTTVTQQVNAGTLSLSSEGTASLSSITVDVASSQNSTGNLGDVVVTDNRGSGVGWSATMTSTHFIHINNAVRTSGTNDTLTSGGTYNQAAGGTYTITITTGGVVGVALFSVSGLETATNQTTGSGVAVGTRGVTATFGAATYSVGDSWTIRIDTIPVTNFTVTPGSVTTLAGSSTGVTAGGQHAFSSTSDATTIMTATNGNGMGAYSNNPALQLVIPAATYANSYTATVTQTVN